VFPIWRIVNGFILRLNVRLKRHVFYSQHLWTIREWSYYNFRTRFPVLQQIEFKVTALTYKIRSTSVQRICTLCCRTTSVNPRRHCGRHLGRFYTYHELELSTAVTPSVSLHRLYGTVCPLSVDITNIINRLKTLLFHHTHSGSPAAQSRRQSPLNLRTSGAI